MTHKVRWLAPVAILLINGSGNSARAFPVPDHGTCPFGGSGNCVTITTNINSSGSAIFGGGNAGGVGVNGVSNGGGNGVAGTSVSGSGVYGSTASSITTNAGVSGAATGGAIGVRGENTSTGIGVYGTADQSGGHGVHGFMSGSGAGAAIYGDAQNSNNAWGGFFVGDVSAVTYFNNSDARLKTDIKDLTYGLNELMKLRPVTYKWKANIQRGDQIGLIAQEVQKIFPEVVRTDPATGLLAVNYIGIVPVVIKAIQEQQQQIAQQRQTLETQAKRIAALEARRESVSHNGLTGFGKVLGFGLLPLGLVAGVKFRRGSKREKEGGK